MLSARLSVSVIVVFTICRDGPLLAETVPTCSLLTLDSSE